MACLDLSTRFCLGLLLAQSRAESAAVVGARSMRSEAMQPRIGADEWRTNERNTPASRASKSNTAFRRVRTTTSDSKARSSRAERAIVIALSAISRPLLGEDTGIRVRWNNHIQATCQE